MRPIPKHVTIRFVACSSQEDMFVSIHSSLLERYCVLTSSALIVRCV